MKIEKHCRLPFGVKQVYATWISSDTIIAPATRMDINPVIGGHYRLFIEGPEFTAACEGAFSKIIPNELLQYSWEWNGDGGISEITVKFKGSDISTDIQLTHDKFATEESVSMHDTGWDSYIDGLIDHLNEY